MAKLNKRTMAISDEVELKTLKAKVAEQSALIDYLAAMTDVEIPFDEGGEDEQEL
ncbi:MAG: hypothetical protein IJ899_20860 [Blautia sp.]|nr:hypothetical protein [Blautia sp.]